MYPVQSAPCEFSVASVFPVCSANSPRRTRVISSESIVKMQLRLQRKSQQRKKVKELRKIRDFFARSAKKSSCCFGRTGYKSMSRVILFIGCCQGNANLHFCWYSLVSTFSFGVNCTGLRSCFSVKVQIRLARKACWRPYLWSQILSDSVGSNSFLYDIQRKNYYFL